MASGKGGLFVARLFACVCLVVYLERNNVSFLLHIHFNSLIIHDILILGLLKEFKMRPIKLFRSNF